MKRLHAWAMSHASPYYEKLVDARKKELFSDVHGITLEIGPGTGPNLKYYDANVQWIGIEPNPHMHSYLRKEAEAQGRWADVRLASAEKLPIEDNSIDFVVSTLVLCSVPDPQATLREALRVLKPGGRLVFLEHVAAPRGTALYKFQRTISTPWRWLVDGCHPDRETGGMIQAAGFSDMTLDEFRLPLGIVAPQIAGWARK